MVSSAIWKKHARVSFLKTIKDYLKSLKNSRVLVFQIARETMLLLINSIREKNFSILLIFNVSVRTFQLASLTIDRPARIIQLRLILLFTTP